jgi:hypothetical protein
LPIHSTSGACREDLRPTLALLLGPDLARQDQQRPEAFLEDGVAVDLAVDVADHSAETGAQELELSAGTLELMGVAVAPDHDGSPLGHAQVALAQFHTMVLGELDQLLQRPVHEPGIGRMGDRLGLHGGVHRHPLQVLGLERAGLVADRQALLDQGRELILTQPTAPAAQRRAVERQLVAERQLAAEVLVIRVLQPASAQHFVR